MTILDLINFKSYSFVFFLLVSLLCYYVTPRKWQRGILLCANTFFYIVSGPLNFIFILITAISTFFGAKIAEKMNLSVKEKKDSGIPKDELKIYKAKIQTKKRAVLILTIIINFGILFFLKYFGAIARTKSLLLPLGISFYTFQTFAYFMDVYNGKYEGEKNFLQYFLFVSFFPQLIMGPINRYDSLGQQLKNNHDFDFENIKHGILLILFGAMKKYCIADMLVLRISAVLDHEYSDIPGIFILFGVLSYAIYQYADFSGGIDMVQGVAKLFGLEMAPNFRQPYFATTLGDFWRRWHISLGAWMKDYVFYPLALTKKMQSISKFFLNKKNALGKHLARTIPAGIGNLVVFLFVGVWHGPEMHFVLWGLYNGLVIALSDLLKPIFEKINAALHIPTKSFGWRVFQIVRTFIIVNIGGYFDRIVDVPKSFLYFKRTFTNFWAEGIFTKNYMKTIFGDLRNADSELMLILIAGTIVFITSIIKERKIDLYNAIQKKNIAARWAAYYIPLLLVIISMSYAPGNPVFMYAQY